MHFLTVKDTDVETDPQTHNQVAVMTLLGRSVYASRLF